MRLRECMDACLLQLVTLREYLHRCVIKMGIMASTRVALHIQKFVHANLLLCWERDDHKNKRGYTGRRAELSA